MRLGIIKGCGKGQKDESKVKSPSRPCRRPLSVSVISLMKHETPSNHPLLLPTITLSLAGQQRQSTILPIGKFTRQIGEPFLSRIELASPTA